MRAPQVIMVVLMTCEVMVHLKNHGELRRYNFGLKVLDTAALVGLLYWGGFFK